MDGGPPGITAQAITAQAPVLLVTDLFDGDLCRRLIDFWNVAERFTGVVSGTSGDIHSVVDSVKRRLDAAIPNSHPAAQEIADIVGRRIAPEIKKAFQFSVTRMETLRIGCYDSADSGFFGAHRDNTTPFTAHRRFAMSVNLNTGEYEGGALRFPEYGPMVYAPPAGGAVVFSCSLLHEALPVTAGRRFGLFTFFHSDNEKIDPAMMARGSGFPAPRG